MRVSDMKLVAGALEHYAVGNPGNSPESEIERVAELANVFWRKAKRRGTKKGDA